MTPTPEQLAAADAIDPRKYEGHTPGPWYYDETSGTITQTQPITRDVWLIPRNEADAWLLENAPLIPMLVHQRDEARREALRASGECEKAQEACDMVWRGHDVARRRVEELETALLWIRETGFDGIDPKSQHGRCVRKAASALAATDNPERGAETCREAQ